MDKKWKRRLLLFYRGWGFSLIIAILIATSFKSAIADWNDIPSGSMKPTILIGDRIFVNKLAYDLKLPYTTWHLAQWADPERGDIVVFYSPNDGKRLVKRVVGLPGDIIAMYKNQLFIDGVGIKYEPLDNEIINQIALARQSQHFFFSENIAGKKHPVMFASSRPSLNSFGPVTVPKGKYFMLGDNRDNSADSRFFGFVDRKFIVGRASAVVISRDESFLHPRWNRFFQTLM
ncbi:MAG: signal peptidase I [Deltaproteobacteria bacterium]|nr:signal peptidase I [Deltaproteobacteria bacterium]